MHARSVGVFVGGNSDLGLPRLRNQLLFWDQLAIGDLDGLLQRSVRDAWSWPFSTSDLERLRDEEVIVDLPVPEDAENIDTPAKVAVSSDRELRDVFKTLHSGSIARSNVCRAMAAELRTQKDLDAVSIVPFQEDRESASMDDVVLSIHVNSLPIPQEAVPIADIVQFRNEHGRKLHALRLWASEIGQGALQGHEAEEKFESLAAEYRALFGQMRSITPRGAFTSVVTASPAVLENMVRRRFGARFGRAETGATSIVPQNAALLPQERQEPGRVVSYLVRERDAWRSRPAP